MGMGWWGWRWNETVPTDPMVMGDDLLAPLVLVSVRSGPEARSLTETQSFRPNRTAGKDDAHRRSRSSRAHVLPPILFFSRMIKWDKDAIFRQDCPLATKMEVAVITNHCNA